MTEATLLINLVTDNKIVHVPYGSTTTAEDVCITLCKQLCIGPVARHLFALRVTGSGKQIFLMSATTFVEKNPSYDLRVRFKVANVSRLKEVDRKAYDYYFHQARCDVLENKIPDLIYEKYKRELVGLGVTDMYRVMLEKDIPREIVENDYKKYIPKEVIKRHSIFIKKPIHDTLGKIKKAGHDAWYVKMEYLKQLEIMAPEYLAEEYKALTDQDGSVCNIYVKVSPYHPTEPGIKICYESKREEWQQICTIEELCYISVRKDGTVEISRKNGIPFYLKFNSVPSMLSFVSVLDGYYRLTCKWIFNLCKDVPTPSLQKLYSIKCHGPVGGEFSYAKLEEKRGNHSGCFILRESETKYNIYYIDVCMKDNSKPKTFKLERLTGDEFIFNDDLRRYKSIHQLMAAYNDPLEYIYLQECLPPSEYDKSPLLLCQSDCLSGDSLTDSSAVHGIIPATPLCINSKDIQVYKDRKCLKWNKARNRVKYKGGYSKQEKFENFKFPDKSLSNAKKYCRNPDGDIAGPWCFVEIEDTDEVEREYCDIPFCDDQDCTVFSKNYSLFSHYTDFNHTLTNLTFGLKIWDSDSYLTASARLVLSVLALPLTGKQIDDAGIGLEIFISNQLSALTFGNKDKPEYESSINVLKSTEFTFFSLTWGSGFISLTKEGENKPIFLAEYKLKNNLLGFMKDKFHFYSFQGANVLWSFPFCDDDGDCDVHTTTSSMFQQFWPLRETNVGRDLQFHVRAFHSVCILLVTSPVINFPYIKIVLDTTDNFTRIISAEYESRKTVLKEIALNPLLDYWKWNEFSISLFADTLHIYWTKDVGTHMIIEIKNELIRKLRWFSPSSENTMAHWTFYCKPAEFADPPNAWPPECALNKDEPDYKGTQGVTNKGLPCVPWSSKKLLPENVKDSVSDKDILKAVNYCRDPTNEQKGTYCYAITSDPDVKINKHYCLIRKCKSAECKMAGTANDYIGNLYTTRSNRTCENWEQYIISRNTSNNGTEDLSYVQYLNSTLYPDITVTKAENFCRNPSRNIAGSWCYTTDSDIQDICNVRDCSMPEECTILVKGQGEGRDIYILPQWKETGIHGGLHFALKEWDPDLLDGIMFEIKPLKGDAKIKLVIGANNNEKIILYYQSKLAKEKTFPHIIPAGKWASFWLQIRRGEILLGYEGIPSALFEWQHDQLSAAFEPVFISYMSIKGHPIGVFFKCDDCHSEITTVKHFTRIMPIGLWSQSESLLYTNLTLNIRGVGTAFIALMALPGVGEYYAIVLNELGNNLFFMRNKHQNAESLLSQEFNEPLITNNSWTTFVITFTERNLNITRNETLIFNYKSTFPMLLYWFSVGATNGPITWTANCDPPDIDGKPLDGGWSHWSPWTCTVSCGGGEGFRTRTCSNPRPNIFGKLCEGSPTSTGVCNDFECGDVSPETLEKIRDRLQMHHFSLIINEGDTVLLENDHEILEIVSEQSPDAYYEWTLNGLFVIEEPDHIEFTGDNIFIKNAEVSDMGVYVCMLHRINKERVVFRLISLAVATTYDRISTRSTLDLTLTSNAVVLGYIYSDLSQKWLLNDTVYIDYGITTLAAVSAEHLKPLNRSHSGLWKCVVEQSDLRLSWVTNLIKVKVKRAPNFYTHLKEDHLTAPLFAWLKTDRNIFIAIICIVVFICAIVVGCVFAYFRWGTLPTAIPKPRRKYKRNRRK